MTVRQEAHGLIDRMPEEIIQVLIPVMSKLIPLRTKQDMEKTDELSPRMQAFMDMQEMRKSAAQYDISIDQREAVMAEKYGEIRWEGSTMTVQQEAISMINSMSEDTVVILVELFKRMRDKENDSAGSQVAGDMRKLPSKRRLGIANGMYIIPDNIDSCNDEIAQMFGVTE